MRHKLSGTFLHFPGRKYVPPQDVPGLTGAGLISGHPPRKPETHPEYLRLPTAPGFEREMFFFSGNLDLLEIATEVDMEVPRLAQRLIFT